MSKSEVVAEFLACHGAQMIPICSIPCSKDLTTKTPKELSDIVTTFQHNCKDCVVKNGIVCCALLEEFAVEHLSRNITSKRSWITVEEAVKILEKPKKLKKYLFLTEDKLVDFFLFLFRTDDFFVWGDRIYTTKSWGKPPNSSEYKNILIIQDVYTKTQIHSLLPEENIRKIAKKDRDVIKAFPLFFKLSGNEVILRKKNCYSFISSETSSEHSICNLDISRALAAAYFQTQLQKSGGNITYAKFDSLLNKASAQIASVIQPKNKDMVRDFISQHCSCAVTEDSFAYARRNEQWESFCRAWFREHLSCANKAIDERFQFDEEVSSINASSKNSNRFAILASHSSISDSTFIEISHFNHGSVTPTCNDKSDGCSRKNKKKRKNKNQKSNTEQVASITPNNDESGSEQEWIVAKNSSSRRSNLMPGAHHTNETIKGKEMEENVSNKVIENNSTIPLAKRIVMQKQKLRGYGEKRTNDILDSETSKQEMIKYVSGRQKQLQSPSTFDSASSVSSLPTSSGTSQSSSSTQYLNDVAADSSGKPKMSGLSTSFIRNQVKSNRRGHDENGSTQAETFITFKSNPSCLSDAIQFHVQNSRDVLCAASSKVSSSSMSNFPGVPSFFETYHPLQSLTSQMNQNIFRDDESRSSAINPYYYGNMQKTKESKLKTSSFADLPSPENQVKEGSLNSLNSEQLFLQNHPGPFSRNFTLPDPDKIDVPTKLLSDVTVQNTNFSTSVTGISKQTVQRNIERKNREELSMKTTQISVFNAEAPTLQDGFLKVEHTRKAGQKNLQSLPRPVVAANSVQGFQKTLVWPQTLRTISGEPISTRSTVNPRVPAPVVSHPAHYEAFKVFSETHTSVSDQTLVSGKQTSAMKTNQGYFNESSRVCINNPVETPVSYPIMLQRAEQMQPSKSASFANNSAWKIDTSLVLENNNLMNQTKHQLSSAPTPLSEEHACNSHPSCSNNPSPSSSFATNRNCTTSENGNFEQLSCAEFSAELKLKETSLAKQLPEMSFAPNDIHKPVKAGPVTVDTPQPSGKCLSSETPPLLLVTSEKDTHEKIIASFFTKSASAQQININVLYARLLRDKPNIYQSVFELSTFVENSEIFSLNECMVQWNHSLKV